MSRRLAAAAGALVLTLALGSCTARNSGPDQDPPTTPAADASQWDPDARGNGLWLLTGDAVIDEIIGAMRAAGPVSYTGSFTELITPEDASLDPHTGRALTVEYAGEDGEMTASIAAGDIHLDVVATGGRTYVRGDAAYVRRTGVAAFGEGFVCTTSPETILSDWEPLLDPAALVETLLSGAEEVSVMEPKPDAATTQVVIGGSESPFGQLSVAAAGPPLPAEFVAGDPSGDGSFTFGEWGTAPEIAAPTELSQPCE